MKTVTVTVDKKYVPCANCKKRSLIANVTLYQTHWYTSPSGCTDGDYWNDGECQFVCHHCGKVNRLLTEILDVSDDFFRRHYRQRFREIINTYGDDCLIPKWDVVAVTMYHKKYGKLPEQNWVNNYWIDTLKTDVARAGRTDATGEVHHVCDACGAKGPTMGKNERICFWLCDECCKNQSNRP